MHKGFLSRVKKTATIILLCAFIFSTTTVSLEFSAPQKVQAACATTPAATGESGVFVPTLDSANLVQNTITAGELTALYTKECVADGLVTIIGKQIIKALTRSIVNWINSGFKGNPAFVTNPQQFFTETADRIAGEFIQNSPLGFMCDPFKLDIRLALRLKYAHIEDNGCKLTDIVKNINGFTGGDFSQGGWGGWIALSQDNNPYNDFLTAEEQVGISIAGAQGQKLLQLNWGRGFLSYEDESGNTQTPGSVIESQLNNALGSDLRGLELADEIDEIVGALVGQLMKSALGATGLLGS